MCHGRNESTAQVASVSVKDPIILTAPACTSSDRIHFHDSTNSSPGNRNDAAPNSWYSRSERYDPGYPMKFLGCTEDAVSHEGSRAEYDTRLSRMTSPS